MKIRRLKKTLYVFVILFLLCHFFSFSPESETNPLSTGDVEQSVSIQVPTGIHFEINTEKTGTTQISDSIRFATNERFSSVHRLILFAVILLCFFFPYFLNGVVVSHSHTTYSQSYILSFIQCKDGKK